MAPKVVYFVPLYNSNTIKYYQRQMKREHENINLSAQIAWFHSMQAKMTPGLVTVGKMVFRIYSIQIGVIQSETASFDTIPFCCSRLLQKHEDHENCTRLLWNSLRGKDFNALASFSGEKGRVDIDFPSSTSCAVFCQDGVITLVSLGQLNSCLFHSLLWSSLNCKHT